MATLWTWYIISFFNRSLDHLHKGPKIICGETKCLSWVGLPGPQISLSCGRWWGRGAVFSPSLSFSENLWCLAMTQGFFLKCINMYLLRIYQVVSFGLLNNFFWKFSLSEISNAKMRDALWGVGNEYLIWSPWRWITQIFFFLMKFNVYCDILYLLSYDLRFIQLRILTLKWT